MHQTRSQKNELVCFVKQKHTPGRVSAASAAIMLGLEAEENKNVLMPQARPASI
jgi:hypothetical protein